MEIFDKFTNLDNLCLALGFFDGVHKGHQAALNKAKSLGTKTAVITFKHHPLETFNKDCQYICSREKRAILMDNIGIDYLFELDFTKELSQMSGEEYLKMLINYFHPKAIITGFNHTFGANKSGNPNLLETKQTEYNYKYYQVPPQKINDEIISSTTIKQLLEVGNIEKANKMLGYEFSIKGKVIHGNHIGRTIGFPTANIEYPNSIVKLPYGVYCTKVMNKYSVTNYGKKPTVGQNTPIVESHILDFDKDIYNLDIEVEFIKKIRDEKRFNSLDELKVQINKDTKTCLKL